MNTKISSLPAAPGYLQFKDVLEAHLSWVVAGWLTGVLVLSLRLLAAWLDAQRIRRLDCRLLDSDWQDRLQNLSSRIGLTWPIQLLESGLARVPMVIGHLRPAVFLPVTALTGLTPQQLEIILAHELAHIRRYDYLANLIQTVIENLLFFNPAVWWVSQKIRIERENACDDIALAVSGDRFAYARTLVRMEELRPAAPARLAVAAAGGSLLDRVRRLLNADAPYAYSTSRSLAGVAVLALVILGLIILYFSYSPIKLPPGSRIDKRGWIVDKTDYPFVNDPSLLGTWKSVDFIREMDDFNPAQPQWNGDLYLKELVFLPEGKAFRPWWTWTKGMIFHSGDHTASGYTLKNLNGATYMFFEWKSGDYVIRHQKPMYYVLKKVSSEVSKKNQAWANASEVDLNFRRLAVEKIPKLDINRATLKDVIQLFGKPLVYAWDSETLDETKLPDRYVLLYSDHFDIFMNKGKIVELRYYNPGYKYKSIEVGSSLEQVLEVLGPPAKTLTGWKNEFKDGILYKDIEGRSGFDYYARKDKGVRMFFTDNKVNALYVTNTRFDDAR